jgi:SNF2 family DNA or RNA helicase
MGMTVKEKILLHAASHNNLEELTGSPYETYSDLKSLKALFRGNFEASLKEANLNFIGKDELLFRTAASKLLEKNEPEAALELFEKGLIRQQTYAKNSQLPFFSLWAMYYIFLLLRQSIGKYTPAIQKIIQDLKKKSHSNHDDLFLLICSYAINEKKDINRFHDSCEKTLLLHREGEYALWAIVALYLTDYNKFEKISKNALLVVEKAFKNGYAAPALEAAYALMQQIGSPKIKELYRKIRTQTGFDAAISRFEKKEKWEIGLELIATVASKFHSSDNKEAGETRIAYFINPVNGAVQPVQQKYSVKTGWNYGRIVSSQKLKEKAVEGMTDQDIRIGQCAYSYIGRTETGLFSFPKKVFREMIGHPYLFLYGSDNVPLELAEGVPEINILKTDAGYKISANIESFEGDVSLVKETNTRYKVFSLTDEQKQIFSVIRQQNLLIPEKGKDKLLETVGHFSSGITVHSDWIQEDSQSTQATVVDPDSRIRVQLLPWGVGLKAELFAKPFGVYPPYCKPGIGGKMLFYNLPAEHLRVNRDLEKELSNVNTLLAEIQTLESIRISEDLISFDHPEDALYLLEVLEKHKDIAIVEWPEGERYKISHPLDFSALSLRIKSKNDWFELQGELHVDENTVLTVKELMALSQQSRGRFIEMKDGAFLNLTKRLKQQIDQLNVIAQNHKKEMQVNRFALVSMADFLDALDHVKADKKWKDIRKQIAESEQEEIAVPAGLQAELRPYQEDGYRWMTRLSAWGAGACLADDMGLGKTIQAICMLLRRANMGPSLVVAPVSVIPNWISEIKKFAPGLNPLALPSNNRKEMVAALQSGDVIIISYGLLQSEDKLFHDNPWSTVILDEAHNIKNFATKTSKAAMSLQASFKLILTGTPIQNHLGEIWNLFNFINPGLLGTLNYFTDSFVKTEREDAKKQLKRLITPFILRRTKTSVLEELPPKTEIIKKIRLTEEETAFYEAVRQQAIEQLEREDGSAKHIKILAEITRLRQACCNPMLVNPDIRIPSTKLSTFLEIVEELSENKHRALVFSQFVGHLSLIRKALDKQQTPYLYLDGSTPMAEREKLVKRFQSGESDLFLISLKAGGLGLNLTGADFVVHLDPWWNPAIEDQASDRTHRIGQTRPVTVYRLVAEQTIEEKIIQLHNTKRDLADSLLEGSDMVASLSAKELLNLIKEG